MNEISPAKNELETVSQNHWAVGFNYDPRVDLSMHSLSQPSKKRYTGFPVIDAQVSL